MLTRTEVVAAAPSWVRARLDGTVRAARIVHAGADAIYVDAGGACLGVLGRFAVAVPCGLWTPLAELPAISAQDGMSATVGGGRLCIDSFDVRVGRTVDVSVPRIGPVPAATAALKRAAGDRLASVRAELPASALTALRAGDATVVPALLGRGSGLTPVGDDVLCGWLATRRAVGADATAVATAVGARAVDATTLLSSTLLLRAVAGDVIPAFRRLLLSLRTDADPEALDTTADALLATGHTSGAGLLLGCVLAMPPHSPGRRPIR